VGERLRPARLQVAEQPARRRDGGVQPLEPEPVQRAHAEALGERRRGALAAELARRARRDHGGRGGERRALAAAAARRQVVGHEQLVRPQPHELAGELVVRDQLELELARGHVARRDAPARVGGRGERDQPVVPALGEQRTAVDGARGDHAHHAPLDQPLPRLAHLLDDRHAMPGGDEPVEVAVELVVGDAGERDAPVPAHRPRGERDPEHARRQLGVAVERLVEVAHAEQQHRVRVLCLEIEILPAGGGCQDAFALPGEMRS
jgi:hypothetical protein